MYFLFKTLQFLLGLAKEIPTLDHERSSSSIIMEQCNHISSNNNSNSSNNISAILTIVVRRVYENTKRN